MSSYLVFSDTHLGASNSQTKRINKVLDLAEDYDRIVVNGDMIDSHIKRLKPKEWKIIERLAKLGDRLIVIKGNHATEDELTLTKMWGVPYHDSFIAVSRGTRFYIEHGMRWDDFIENNPGLTALADSVYMVLQAIDPTHNIAKWAKHSSKAFLRCADKIKEGILGEKEKYNCLYGIVGHSHKAEFDPVRGYINTGCFTEKPCSYLTIKKGEPKLHYL